MNLCETLKMPCCGAQAFSGAGSRFNSPVNDGPHGSALCHTICLNCGSAVKSNIKVLSLFTGKK